MSLLRSSAFRALRRAAAAPTLQSRLVSAAAPRLAVAARAPVVASLHTSVARFGNGSSDSELSARLTQEISYEKESDSGSAESASSSAAVPEFVQEFLADGVWSITDTPGSDEITLTRDFGSEHIRVMFSIGDIDTSETSALAEEDEEGETSEIDEEENSFPVRVAISIQKPNHGALSIDGQAHDGEFSIENISFYKDAKVGTELTADADWARRGLYIGPQFDTLDEAVQTQFEAFLNERGINSDLALFVPEFAELKEQREYCGWLENVRDWVDA